MQAHHCSCPWERHTLCFTLTFECRQIFCVCTDCAETVATVYPQKEDLLDCRQPAQSCRKPEESEKQLAVYKSGNKRVLRV